MSVVHLMGAIEKKKPTSLIIIIIIIVLHSSGHGTLGSDIKGEVRATLVYWDTCCCCVQSVTPVVVVSSQ